MKTLTLDSRVAALAKALADAEENGYGYKAVSDVFTAPCGTVTINMNQRLVRFGYGQSKVVTQLLLNQKVIAKAALQTLMGDRLVPVENAVLKAAFLGLAPDLAAEYAAEVRRVFAGVAYRYPDGKIPAYPEYDDRDYRVIRTLLSDSCAFVEGNRRAATKAEQRPTLVMDEEKLARVAKKYGEEVSLTWYRKTNEKLGGVADVTVSDHRDGVLSVTGMLGGKVVLLSQQRILKRSPKGLLFHQFPARIYVDGKFTTEAAFKKMVA